jgi:small subunit ribosomal protein S3
VTSPTTLAADLKVREMLRKKLAAGRDQQDPDRAPGQDARVTIHTARPGVVIGKRGEDIEKLRKEVSDVMGVPAHINVTEVRKPELDAQLVAESIAQQLERRIMFRRAMKRAVGNAMRLGALGIKVNVGGRLNGAEIARSEWYREGRVPLHTLRADIDYGFAEAKTTYGIIGIKVWVYKGEIFDFSQVGQEKQDDTPAPRAERGDRERPRGPRRDREARD